MEGLGELEKAEREWSKVKRRMQNSEIGWTPSEQEVLYLRRTGGGGPGEDTWLIVKDAYVDRKDDPVLEDTDPLEETRAELDDKGVGYGESSRRVDRLLDDHSYLFNMRAIRQMGEYVNQNLEYLLDEE